MSNLSNTVESVGEEQNLSKNGSPGLLPGANQGLHCLWAQNKMVLSQEKRQVGKLAKLCVCFVRQGLTMYPRLLEVIL